MELSSRQSYSQLPDQLLGTAFDTDNNQAVDELAAHGEKARDLLVESWDSLDEYVADGFRLATMYACLPSLERVAHSRPQSIEVAQQVSTNLQDICGYATADDFTERAYRRPAQRKLIGQLSELAVLGTLWWGVASGYRDSRTYILPATRQQDQGYEKDDYNLATDLILRQSGSRQKSLIQVKSSDSAITKRKELFYHPQLAVVVASELADTPTRAPFPLLQALTRNHRPMLEAANKRIDTTLQTAKQRGIAYRQSRRAA
jgi:hypothetical protein